MHNKCHNNNHLSVYDTHAVTPEVSLSQLESGTIEEGASTRLRLIAPAADGVTFRLCIRRGRIILYASTIPNPSSAIYDWYDEVTATAQPLTCSTTFFDLTLGQSTSENRKRRQLLSVTATLYITLEGQDDINEFTFNSSLGNVTLGMIAY